MLGNHTVARKPSYSEVAKFGSPAASAGGHSGGAAAGQPHTSPAPLRVDAPPLKTSRRDSGPHPPPNDAAASGSGFQGVPYSHQSQAAEGCWEEKHLRRFDASPRVTAAIKGCDKLLQRQARRLAAERSGHTEKVLQAQDALDVAKKLVEWGCCTEQQAKDLLENFWLVRAVVETELSAAFAHINLFLLQPPFLTGFALAAWKDRRPGPSHRCCDEGG